MTRIKLILAICGASGVQYGIELLKALKEKKIEVHLILSEWAQRVINEETEYDSSTIRAIADFNYGYYEMDAAICSSSFLIDTMIICPATIATVSKIASSNTDNTITRAADNMLKMKKPLVISFRETPISSMTLKNFYELSISGATVLPLAPGFYHKPKKIEDLINFMVGKILDVVKIENKMYKRWK
ncbi:MAG: UbiX family flavin prenyltransferase [Candidatus Ranarchaeia archaeon]